MSKWQYKVAKEYAEEILSSAYLYLITLLLISIWDVYNGGVFKWIWINPIEQPSLFVRIFYSAITYFTLGVLLYVAGFYKFLYSIIRNWKIYKEIKSII